jgi:hypothetical protein
VAEVEEVVVQLLVLAEAVVVVTEVRMPLRLEEMERQILAVAVVEEEAALQELAVLVW